jgi:hypothetical protein
MGLDAENYRGGYLDGADVVVLGGGPGLNDIEPEDLRGVFTIGCNSAAAKSPDILFCYDEQVIRLVEARYSTLPSLRVTWASLRTKSPGWLHVGQKMEDGWWSDKPAMLPWCGTSGLVCFNMAAALGAGRIYLVGFEMRPDGLRAVRGGDLYPEVWASQGDVYQHFLTEFERRVPRAVRERAAYVGESRLAEIGYREVSKEQLLAEIRTATTP